MQSVAKKPSPISTSGFAALYVTILIFMVLAAASASMALFVVRQQKILRNSLDSASAYAAAEAGIEDALVRLAQGMSWSSPYIFTFDGAQVTVTISDVLGGARTITAEGEVASRVRKIRAVYQLDFTAADLHYGAHIGNPNLSGGGLHMAHNSAKIIGNVFSNGNVWGNSPATIVNSLIVAGSGNSVSTIIVGENAEAYSCFEATINGNLDYNDGGSNTCTVGGGAASTPEIIAQQDFAITQDMIDNWKADAGAGTPITPPGGTYTVDSDQVLGPVKINGNLHIENNRKLTLNGIIWVTGTFTSNPNAIIELAGDYGDLSGVMIMDGTAHVKNGLALRGSGQPGSFLLFASLSASMDPDNPAIEVGNNADNAILFAPNGILTVGNNAEVVEVVAHRLEVRSATIEYDVGLADARFTSGPGGGWTVASWRGIE